MQESWRRTGNRKSFDPDTWLSSVQDSRKSSAEACDQCLSVHTHVRALGALAMLACWGWRRCAWDDPLVQRGSLSVGGEMCFPVHASTLLWIPFPPEHLLFLTGVRTPDYCLCQHENSSIEGAPELDGRWQGLRSLAIAVPLLLDCGIENCSQPLKLAKYPENFPINTE
jgi:hypothetical protein